MSWLNPPVKQNANVQSLTRSTIDTAIVSIKQTGAKGNGKSDDSFAIQAAVNSAKSNYNVIIFPPGVYKISTPIRTVRPHTKFLFKSNAKLVLTRNDAGAFNISHDYCTIEGGEIEGTGKSAEDIYSGYGVLLLGVENCEIKNNRFTSISGCNIFLNRRGKRGCSNNRITGNTIILSAASEKKFVGASGILLGYSGTGYFHKNNVIDSNIINGNFSLSHGIAIIGHGTNNKIRNNNVSNCLRYGIVSYESEYSQYKLTHTYILNNKVSNIGASTGMTNDMGMGIYLMQSHSSIVKGNTVFNTLINSNSSETLARGAIAIGGSIDCIIENNVINNSGRYGICSAYGFNLKIINNEINGTKKSGIYLINSSNNTIKHNNLKRISGYMIKGSFGHTRDYQYAKTYLVEKYKDVPSGENINISQNVFNGLTVPFIYLKGNAKGQLGKTSVNELSNITIANNTFVGGSTTKKNWLKISHGKMSTYDIHNNRIIQK